jgi:hypothetical protein
LEDGRLDFHPLKGQRGAESFKVSQIKRARRVWGSPVLELRLDIPDGLPVVGFYFIRPPSLEAPEGTRFEFKGRTRRKAVAELHRGNAAKREEIASWVSAISEAKRRD